MINHKNQRFTKQKSILRCLIHSLTKFQNKLKINQHLGSASRDGNRSGQPAPVGSSTRFFDQPVKSVETPVKFPFLETKRHLSTNRNIHKYFIINKTCHKKNSINKPNLLKTLVEWFQVVTDMLRPLRLAHSGEYLGGGRCAVPPSIWAMAQGKKVQNIR